jgi:hypothetical protein
MPRRKTAPLEAVDGGFDRERQEQRDEQHHEQRPQ